MASGYQPNVVAGAPILSSWGNTIRDRSVMVFDTAAQRDTQIPAPTAGMVCYVLATGELLQYSGVAWRKPWNLPWGDLGSFAQTANVAAGGAGFVTLTGATAALTMPANRRIRVDGLGLANGDTANMRGSLQVIANAAAVGLPGIALTSVVGSEGRTTTSTFGVVTSIAGTNNFALQGNRTGATGTNLTWVGPGGLLTLTDVGPVVGSAPA